VAEASAFRLASRARPDAAGAHASTPGSSSEPQGTEGAQGPLSRSLSQPQGSKGAEGPVSRSLSERGTSETKRPEPSNGVLA
jgi:hypothetical protein